MLSDTGVRLWSKIGGGRLKASGFSIREHGAHQPRFRVFYLFFQSLLLRILTIKVDTVCSQTSLLLTVLSSERQSRSVTLIRDVFLYKVTKMKDDSFEPQMCETFWRLRQKSPRRDTSGGQTIERELVRENGVVHVASHAQLLGSVKSGAIFEGLEASARLGNITV